MNISDRLLQQFITLLVGLETSALFLLLLNYVFVLKLLCFHTVTALLSKLKRFMWKTF